MVNDYAHVTKIFYILKGSGMVNDCAHGTEVNFSWKWGEAWFMTIHGTWCRDKLHVERVRHGS